MQSFLGPRIRLYGWCKLLLFLVLLFGVGWYSLACEFSFHSQTEAQLWAQAKLVNPLPPHFSQRDKRWASDKLGKTEETLEESGCTISSTAMALAQQGLAITPGDLHQKLLEYRGLTRRGWLIWSAISRLTQGVYKVTVAPKPSLGLIDGLLEENIPVVAKIRLDGETYHWVLLVGKFKGDYLLFDPLDTNRVLRRLSSYKSQIFSIRWAHASQLRFRL